MGDKWHKSLDAKEWAREEGLSVQEAEHSLDAELFLDEYPRMGCWRTTLPHHSPKNVLTGYSGVAEGSSLPCGPDQMEEAIKDILSSLRSCLQR